MGRPHVWTACGRRLVASCASTTLASTHVYLPNASSPACRFTSKIQVWPRRVFSDDELKLEYFFYTDAPDKASALAADLAQLGYTVEHRPAAHDKRRSVITGWTTPMVMSQDVVDAWSQHMCELGFKHDCDFDGWGTTPDQKVTG